MLEQNLEIFLVFIEAEMSKQDIFYSGQAKNKSVL